MRFSTQFESGSTFSIQSGTGSTSAPIKLILTFLDRSFFFVDAYPYFPWSANPMDINLDFALFNGNFEQIDRGSGLVYTNLLDEMLDSLIFAMTKLGYPDIRLVISETGWPTTGDIEQPGAKQSLNSKV